MSDRYLWDKSGEPDPGVERLERVLGSLAHRDSPLALPEEGDPIAAPASIRARTGRARHSGWMPALAWAAALMVVSGLGWWMWPRGWKVETLAGRPRVGQTILARGGRIGRGETLETDRASSARLAVGRIGIVDLGPDSRLRVIATRPRDHRLALDHGRLEAFILAPPRQFAVETPSATAIDLGCAYALDVDRDGTSTLTVVAGWVSFEHHGRETFVPAGARCITRVGAGPGTPYFTDAAPALKNALAQIDLAGVDVPDSAIGVVLGVARREDAFTLWHLVARVSGDDRARVVDRLATLVPLPEGASRQGALDADPQVLEQWWNQLGFGAAADWRRWRGSGPGPTGTP